MYGGLESEAIGDRNAGYAGDRARARAPAAQAPAAAAPGPAMVLGGRHATGIRM